MAVSVKRLLVALFAIGAVVQAEREEEEVDEGKERQVGSLPFVAAVADGERAMSVAPDGEVRIVKPPVNRANAEVALAEALAVERKMVNDPVAVRSPAIDGRRAMIVGPNGEVRLVEPSIKRTNTEQRKMVTERVAVQGPSVDGKRVISVGPNGEMRIMDAPVKRANAGAPVAETPAVKKAMVREHVAVLSTAVDGEDATATSIEPVEEVRVVAAPVKHAKIAATLAETGVVQKSMMSEIISTLSAAHTSPISAKSIMVCVVTGAGLITVAVLVASMLPAKFLRVAVCVVYIAFTVSIDLSIALQSNAGHDGYGLLNPACAVMVTESLKLILSSTLFLVSRVSAETPMPTLALSDVRWLALPGLIFTTNNVLVWFALGNNDPATFGIFRDTVLLWTSLIWCSVFKVTLGTWRILGIFTIFAGLVLNKAGHAAEGEEFSWSFLWILVLALTNSTGSVTNEYALKRVPGQDINLQNMVLYLSCATCAATFLFITDRAKLSGPSHFFEGFTSETCFTCMMQSLSGLLVSRLLKYADSITKTVASALRGPALVIVAPFFVTSSTDTVTMVSCLVVAAGCFAYLSQGPLHVEKEKA